MIYLPEEKWSPRYDSEFYTVRMNTWYYVRNEEESKSLLANHAGGIDAAVAGSSVVDGGGGGDGDTTLGSCNYAGADDDGAESSNANTINADAPVTLHESEHDAAEISYDDNDENSDNNNSATDNAPHPNMTKKMTATTTTTTCSFLGISSSTSSTANSCFCCHPGIIAANTGNNASFTTKKESEQPRQKTESFPAVYYEIQVFIGRGGNSTIRRKKRIVVFRRYSHFRALCQEMDAAADEKSKSRDGDVHTSGSGSVDKRRHIGSISDLMTKCLHPKQQPPFLLLFNLLLSRIQLWKLAWSELSSSSASSSRSNEYFHDRMTGLHTFLHTLLCRQECANNPLIDKFLGLKDA